MDQQSPITPQSCEQLQAQLPSYADGELDAPERERIAAHLKTCSQCRARYEFLLHLPAALEQSLPAPSTQLHTRVMHAVRQTPQLRPASRSRIYATVAAALCFCLIGIALLQNGFSPARTEDNAGNTAQSEQNSATDGGEIGSADLESSLTEPQPESSFDGIEEENGCSEADESSSPDSPTLTLPATLTLHFEKQYSNTWLGTGSSQGYSLLLYGDGTLFLCDENGASAQGAYDEDGNVVLLAFGNYQGRFTTWTNQEITLQLTRRSPQ